MLNLLEAYGKLLGKRPYLVLGICILLFIISNIGSSLIKNEVTDFNDQVPDNIESIKAFEFIGDEFGETGSNVIYVVEIDPSVAGSTESRDIRDPEILEFMKLVSAKISSLDEVNSVTSAASIISSSNSGKIPRSKSNVMEIMETVRSQSPPDAPDPFSFFISEDYTTAAIRVNYFTAASESEAFVDELLKLGEETIPPLGVKLTATGGPITDTVLNRQIGPTFAITGTLSFVGIFIVVVLLFYSLRYGLTSLIAVVFGSTWAFGFAGFIGFSLTPQTSGALSLILGIGIDFGIQVVMRFRQELRNLDPRDAIAKTMPNVIPPMTIATLSIVLGFKALSFGNLQFIGALGDIMALGVLMSYLAAITVVPSILVVLNTIKLKRFTMR